MSQLVLKYRKKNIFLVSEVGVESAAGFACNAGDVLKARKLESIARENLPGCLKQVLASIQRTALRFRSLLPARACAVPIEVC